MEVGDIFEAWGDQVANYDYPKDCYFEKIDSQTAVEILNLHTGEEGIKVLIDPNDNFDLTTDV